MEPIRNLDYFITGFQGIGMVGYLVVQHISKTLDCRRIGYLRIRAEPPYSAYIMSSNQLSTPGEIYSCPGTGFTLGIVHWGDALGRFMHDIAKTMARWIYLNGFRLVITFGGLDNRLRGDDDSPLRVATTTAYGRRFSLTNAKLMEVSYAMVGPLALLMNELERLDVPAISILPYAEVTRVDPNAAIVGIRFLEELTGVRINVDKLVEFAEFIERELRELQSMRKEREGPPHYI